MMKRSGQDFLRSRNFLAMLPFMPTLLLMACSDSGRVTTIVDGDNFTVLPAASLSTFSQAGAGSTLPADAPLAAAGTQHPTLPSRQEQVQPLLLPGPDRDGDGLRNQEDLDDDNDGILDVDEGAIDRNADGVLDADSRDSDHDGTPDAWDLDSDNDGITDLREILHDDALLAILDEVANGAIDIVFNTGVNGVADRIETATDSGVLIYHYPDTDSDGERNVIDLDSDNDSIPDVVEAGGSDIDADGRIDDFTDADGKGVDDRLFPSGLELFDTDGDGVADYLDADSDGDGLGDREEAGPQGSLPQDTDGDGAPDYRELDSNNDGIPDALVPPGASLVGSPGHCGLGNRNSTGDGLPDSSGIGGPDRDGDGVPNTLDLDDDNDGVLDIFEGAVDEDGDGFLDASSRDLDNDGTPDAWDLDSDNDGIADLRESVLEIDLIAMLPNIVDGVLIDDTPVGSYEQLDRVRNGAIDISFPVGRNGVADLIETDADSGVVFYQYADSDFDGQPDAEELDSDGDSIPDLVEAGGTDSDGNGRIDNFCDADGKGVHDRLYVSGLEVFDTDGDGVPDFRDTDSDNDGRTDRQEAGSNGSSPQDSDGNGAPDYRQAG